MREGEIKSLLIRKDTGTRTENARSPIRGDREQSEVCAEKRRASSGKDANGATSGDLTFEARRPYVERGGRRGEEGG